jgi:hypothetical protein
MPPWYHAAVDSEAARKARARARASWTGSLHRLGDEAEPDLLAITTASERVAMVYRLTQDAWAMRGLPVPDYARSEAPGRLVRKHGSKPIT